MRVTNIVIQWENTRGMQVGIDIGNQSDGYREVLVLAVRGMAIVLQWEDSRGMPVGTDEISYLSFYRINSFFSLFAVINKHYVIQVAYTNVVYSKYCTAHGQHYCIHHQ